MASFEITTVQAAAGSFGITIQRESDGFYWQPTGSTWAAAPVFSNKNIPCAEGLNENGGSYVAIVAGLSAAGEPGKVRIRIHNTGVGTNPTVAVVEGYVVEDVLVGVDAAVSTRATPAQVTSGLTTVLDTSFEMDELTERPPARPTIRQALMLMYMLLRNRTKSTADRLLVYNSANQVIMEATLTRTEADFTRDALRNA